MFGLTPDQQAFLFKAFAASAFLVYMVLAAWLATNRHRLVEFTHTLYL